jgi:hypothetical protein
MRRRPGTVLSLASKSWCCGSLKTGSISVAFTNIVSLILLSLWIMQDLATHAKHAFISVVVACLVVFVLLVANVCLIYGAMTSKRHMIAPWLVMYVVAILGILVACAIKFDEMGALRVVSVTALFFIIYFYVVVASFYAELCFEAGEAATVVKVEAGGGKVVSNGRDHCLIALDEDDNNDTFSDLVLRVNPSSSRLDTSKSETPKEATLPFKANFLPQPDEVIAIPQKLALEASPEKEYAVPVAEEVQQKPNVMGDENDALLTRKEYDADSDAPDGAVAAKSVSSRTLPLFADDTAANTTSSTNESGFSGSKRYKPKQQTSAKNLLRHSNSALVGDIDTTFTPYKSGSASALAADMPKMR